MESDDTELIRGRVRILPGKHIQFDRGEYNTEDKKEIEFLRKYAEVPANKVFEQGAKEEEVEKEEKETEKPKEEK